MNQDLEWIVADFLERSFALLEENSGDTIPR
jgi:hypothetical protein